MRNVFIVVIILLFTPWLGAGQSAGESYVDSLNALAWNVINTDPDHAHALASLAFTTAKSIKYEEGMALAYNRFGKIHFTRGNFDSAVFYYGQNLKLRFKEKNKAGLANTCINIGDVYLKKGDQVRALKYYRRSGQLFASVKDTAGLIVSHLRAGTLFIEQVNYHAAEKSFESALLLAQPGMYEGERAYVLTEMGNLFSLTQKYSQAIRCYNQASSLFYEWNDEKNLAMVNNSLGNLYYHLSDYNRALEYYKRSKDYYENEDDEVKETVLTFNIGTVFYEQKKNAESIRYLEKALHSVNKRDAYLTQKILYTLSKAYYDLKQYDKAFYYDARYDSVTSALFNTERDKQISELEIQYEVKEKQNQIRLLKATEELQHKTIEQKTHERNAWLAGALLLLAVVFVIYLGYRQKKKANAILTTQKSMIEQQHKEKELLLREIHHRVKNNLQVVSSILSLQSYKITDKNVSLAMKESRARVEAMSMIHRELYHDEKLTHISLPGYLLRLLDQVSKSYGFDETNLATDIEINVEEVDVETAIPLGLIVNEVLSNSFKHAFADVPEPLITLKINREDNHLLLTLKDNGKGPVENPSNRSFGMELVQSLTKQLKGSLTTDHSAGTAYTFILHEHKRWKM